MKTLTSVEFKAMCLCVVVLLLGERADTHWTGHQFITMMLFLYRQHFTLCGIISSEYHFNRLILLFANSLAFLVPGYKIHFMALCP